ncbi:MAG: hypothetical protein IH861_04105 [Chloroflexi bacterium]|nr:hypothetical protein [Chloroflexota bacterium]
MANPEHFRVALEELRDRLNRAVNSLEILRVLLPITPDLDELEKRVKETTDTYIGFFEPTIDALISQILVLITVITEKKGKRNDSLNKLLEEVDSCPDFAPDLSTSAMSGKLDGIKEVVGRIHQKRHNSVAHLNVMAEGRTIFLDEIYKVLQILQEILDDIYLANNGKHWSFSAWDTRDTRRLMESLWEYKILEPIADRIFYSATQDEGDPSRYYIPSELFEKLEAAFDSFKPLRSG